MTCGRYRKEYGGETVGTDGRLGLRDHERR